MPSPFPGIDPFIEVQDRWHSFHTSFIVACSDQLNRNLPPGFYATVEERVLLDADDPGDSSARRILHRFGPDATIVQKGSPLPVGDRPSSVATLVPRTLPQEIISLDQPTQKLVEIHGLPNRNLITTIELLSPSNKKSGMDRAAYLSKRADMLRHDVNVVDLDLLRAGQRLSLLAPLPAGEYHAFVTRAAAHDSCEVYSWTVRDVLPTISVPLKPDLSDVALPLQAAFNQVYDSGRYVQMLMYEDSELLKSLPEQDRKWAGTLINR